MNSSHKRDDGKSNEVSLNVRQLPFMKYGQTKEAEESATAQSNEHSQDPANDQNKKKDTKWCLPDCKSAVEEFLEQESSHGQKKYHAAEQAADQCPFAPLALNIMARRSYNGANRVIENWMSNMNSWKKNQRT